MPNQKLKYAGGIQQLRDMLLMAGADGEWAELGKFWQFRSTEGGILNCWPATGTLTIQGNPHAKNDLSHLLLSLLQAPQQHCGGRLVSRWTTIDFGRYKNEGMSLPQIALMDPGYFLFLYGDCIFQGQFRREVTHVADLCSRIAIPREKPEDFWIAHFVSKKEVYERFEIVPGGSERPRDGRKWVHQEVLDLSILRRRWPKDRFVSQRMSRSIIRHYFDGKTPSRSQCEQFFDEATHFRA